MDGLERWLEMKSDMVMDAMQSKKKSKKKSYAKKMRMMDMVEEAREKKSGGKYC